MKFQNEGSIDRIARVVVGAGILSLVFVGPQTPWGWIGLIPLGTGVAGWCPLYTLLGLNSCAKNKRHDNSEVSDNTAS